jgi:hypothetical protein
VIGLRPAQENVSIMPPPLHPSALATRASHTESIAFWVFLVLDVVGEGFPLDRLLARDW